VVAREFYAATACMYVHSCPTNPSQLIVYDFNYKEQKGALSRFYTFQTAP